VLNVCLMFCVFIVKVILVITVFFLLCVFTILVNKDDQITP